MTQMLDDLLDQVAAALLEGKFAVLATLAPQIEAFADRMSPGDRSATRQTGEKAERNARLLEAARRGVASAQRRLNDIVSGPTLTTYDALGRRSAVSSHTCESTRRV